MSSLVQRVVNILKAPRTEWPVIAGEPATIGGLYTGYILILAAIGPLASLAGGGGFGFFRLSMGFMLGAVVWRYCISLVTVALLAWLINALAPSFGGTKDSTQAFKTATYASTASWIAGIAGLLGFLGALVLLAGAVYSIYLLYLGLPHTMKAPQDKAAGYTVVIVVAAIVLSIVLGTVLGGVMFGGRMLSGGFGAHGRDPQVFTPDSPMGRLEKMGKDMEKAEKEGRTQDPGQAVGAVVGALSGTGSAPAEALPVDTLKGLIPEQLAGQPRKSISAQRNGMLGVQVAVAEARYGEGDHALHLALTDSGGAAALMALAGWANIEQSSEENGRTEHTGKEGGRMVHEVWDGNTKQGEFSVVIANRFVAKVDGHADSAGDLRAAMAQVDLAHLESLRNEGVK